MDPVVIRHVGGIRVHVIETAVTSWLPQRGWDLRVPFKDIPSVAK